MTGLHLLLFAIIVAAIAPRLLTGADWVKRSPRLGIAAWYATLASIGLAAVAAAVSWLAPWQQRMDAPVCLAWRWCQNAATGQFGAAGRLAFYIIVGAAFAFVARMTLAAVRVGRAASARRRSHVQALDLTATVWPELGASVVDHPQPAAYVVAGHDRRIVITTGALAQLRPDELAAVLAHERAHARGRHDLILDGIRLLQRGFPNSRLLGCARSELARLVELRADDVAATEQPRLSLARALVAMATATENTTAHAPALVLAATGGDAMARLQRLLTPPQRLTGWQRYGIAAALAVVAAAPVALLVAAQAFPILGTCPQLLS